MSLGSSFAAVRNSSHKNSARAAHRYFEWWYFQFISENFRCNLVLHETDIFGMEVAPYVSMTYQFAGKPPVYLKKVMPVWSIDNGNSAYLQSGHPADIKEDASAIKLCIVFDDARFEAIISKDTLPVALNGGLLYEDGTQRSYWVANVPHGLFFGELLVDNHVTVLQGQCYQDHQWGNLFLQEWVQNWVWGHFANESSSSTFFVIQAQDREIVARTIVTTPLGLEASASVVSMTCFNQFSTATDLALWESSIGLSTPNGTSLSSLVCPSNLMRCWMNEEYSEFTASYGRWFATANQRNPSGDFVGITEHLRIRRKNEKER